MTAVDEDAYRSKVAQELKDLGASHVLVRMAMAGQIVDVRCEMPKCYHAGGRGQFDKRSSATRPWTISADHYPILKSQGGKLDPWNVRIGHVHCNNEDFGWRSRIDALLRKGKSLEEIAETLSRKRIKRPHGSSTWTAASVRKWFVS